MQYELPASLPPPDELSAQHSALVRDHIRRRIDDAGGKISFAEFMHEALYAPRLGYYSAGSAKFGASGDFVTAPEISSIFGRVLARQSAEVLGNLDNGEVLEIGAGSGKLAVDMLLALDELNALPGTYNILEVSADLQDRQRSRLRRRVPHLVDRVRWLSGLPAEFCGVIIANEVLDALPVERFVQRDAGPMQLCVALQAGSFVGTETRARGRLAALIAEIEADTNRTLADGYTSEASLAAPVWIADLARSLKQGVALLFDYGLSRREYYAADRVHGWLRCHFRHCAHDNPLILPGIQDVTSWVDFSAIAGAAGSNGLDLLGYQTQSQFLMGGGLEQEMLGFTELPPEQQIALSGQIKTLTLPGAMGENFKCIALGCGAIEVPSAFHFADRTRTL